MGQLQAKQIQKIVSSWIKLTGLSVTSGASTVNVTSQLTSALTVAGEGSISVPLISSTATSQNGVVTNSPVNRVEIWDNVTKAKLTDAAGNELYARMSFSTPNYTISFYSLISGTETAFSFTSNATIDFDFVYRFRFQEWPADAPVSETAKNVSQDPKGTNSVEQNQSLTVTATNTLSNLSSIPATSTRTKLYVNGKEESPLGSSPSFSVSGVVITWNAANAGYSLETTDSVTVIFYI